VESTYNWYWLVDGLMENGHRMYLANSAAIQQYQGLKYTSDDSDARWLARLISWEFYPKAISIAKKSDQLEIYYVSVASWCTRRQLISFQS